jgi:hypothetical protein
MDLWLEFLIHIITIESGALLNLSKQAKHLLPLRLAFSGALCSRGWLESECLSLNLGVCLFGLTPAEDGGDGILGLDAVHLHVVATLGDVVLMGGAVLAGAQGFLLLVHDDDTRPCVEEVNRLSPEITDGRKEVFERGIC